GGGGAGVGGGGGCGGTDEIDLAAKAQLGGDLGGGVAAGLAVLADVLSRVGAPAALQALRQDAAHLLEDESVSLAEAGKRSRARTHMTDLDHLALGIDRDHAQHGRGRNAADEHSA